MRWKTKSKAGDERVVEKFAILPLELTDGNTIWFEKYYLRQKCYSFVSGIHWSDKETFVNKD